jgi:pimeloyl-ACP methyl ester carboxylesterase
VGNREDLRNKRVLDAGCCADHGSGGAKDPYVLGPRILNSAGSVTGPGRYVRFEDAGHWVPLDQPDKLNKSLIEFFRP